MAGKDEERPGFSEEALRGLDDLELRLPPPESYGDAVAPRPHYWGHRERLRQRFLGGGHAAMPEYELLELVLFNAIPRIDVKPLAKALLATFGDLNGVVAASEHRLLQVPGTTPKVYLQLKVVEAVAHRMARARVMERSVISSWEALMRLLPHGDGLPRHRAVPHPLPRPQERADRRRGPGQGHRRPRAGLSRARWRSARSSSTRARSSSSTTTRPAIRRRARPTSR